MSAFNRLTRITLIVLIISTAIAVAGDDSSMDLLRQYFDNLATGNYETAEQLWSAADQERAGRFGISYDSIVVRADASSPIVQNLAVMRNYLEPPARQMEEMPGDTFQRLSYSAVVGTSNIKYVYWARKDQKWFWLCYPQDFYARSWPVVESKYLRIHVHPQMKSFLSPVLLNEVDRFVVAMADTLKIPKATLAQMATQKIEWFYCDADQTVEDMTGQKTKGMLDLGSNDIISATFPHYHELVHLLVNIKLKTLPLHTLPLLREGLAVRYGGRWGKSNSALSDLGAYLYREKLVELDSIIVDKGYEGMGEADIVYPVAGIFVSFLLDRVGMVNFLNGYVKLSGSGTYLMNLKSDEIKKSLIAMANYPTWDSLVAGFDAYLTKAAIDYAVAAPGTVPDGSVISKDSSYTITQSKDWIGFEFSLPDTVSPHGSLLFGPMPEAVNLTSSLFVEQYTDQQPFEGYRYAVRFDQNEAGLYDYVTNQLLAKYIWGITPSDEYYKKDKKLIAIKFKKSLVGKSLPTDGHVKMLHI